MEPLFVTLPYTPEPTLWSIVLLTKTGKHLAAGVWWSACLAAVKDFKCNAHEDDQDIVVVQWTYRKTQPWPCQWTWDSLNDSPAGLPTWSNDYEHRVQAHS